VSGPHTHALYVHGHTRIHRLAPQCKLAAQVAFVFAVVLPPREAFWAFGLYAAMLGALVAAARLPFSFVVKRLVFEVPFLLFAVLTAATVLGDSVNFSIGRRVGRRAAKAHWIKPEHLERTHAFFQRHGRKTIFLARFVPIVRPGAPLVAGLSETPYRFFLLYNVFGAVAWVAIFVSLGYFFGSLPVVHDHFALAVGAVLIASGVPGVYEWWKARRRKRREGERRDGADAPDDGDQA